MKHTWLIGVICVIAAIGVMGCRRNADPVAGPVTTPSDAGMSAAGVDMISPSADAVLTDFRRAWQVDYLVIAADDLVEAVGPLVAHRRADGLSVGVARMSDVRELGSIDTLLVLADTTWPEPAPQYLLLVGGADSVPPVVKPGRFVVSTSFTGADRDIATDFDYALHHTRNDVVEDPATSYTRRVGRLPAGSLDELAGMVRKIIDYETAIPPGPWQRRVHFVASVGGYGQAVDRMLEDQFGQIVSAMPPLYDTEVAYSAPTSNFCPYPPKFNDNAIDMFNRGCLFYVFIGHGSPTAVDTIRWREQWFSILTSHDAERLDARTGPPVMVVLACSTGRFDRDGDCLGETLLKAPGGPVAFIGGSRITQPYANTLLANAMATHFFRSETIGNALTLAKADVLAHKSSAVTFKADLAASLVQGKENLPRMRQDVVEHYNLLGDPAMKLRHPADGITLTLIPAENRTEITAPGQSHVTLELLGDRMARVAPTDMPEDESAAMARYRAANTYILHQTRVELQNGKATFDLADLIAPLPQPATSPLWLRATTETAAATVKIKPTTNNSRGKQENNQGT